MIRILLYIAGVLNLSQLIILVSLAITGNNYEGVLMLIISCIAGLFVQIGLYIHYKYLSNREIILKDPPNGEQPATLGRILGIGVLLVGKWRKYADTYVGYTFFFFILPLFPTGCYRYKVVKSEINQITYRIYGSEESLCKEIFCIYAYFYSGIIWVFSLIMQFVFYIM